MAATPKNNAKPAAAKAAATKVAAKKTSATKASAKPAPAAKKVAIKAPAKKASPAKRPTPAKNGALAKQTAAAKKVAPAKKAAPAKKVAPAKSAAPVKKAAPAKSVAPAKKVAPAKSAAPAKKAAAAKVAAPAKQAAPKKAAPKPEPVKKAPRKPTTVICPLSGFEVKPEKPGLSPKTIERLQASLLDERTRHVQQAADLQAEADQLAAEREGGDTQFDEESGEGDTINIERERDLLLSASAQQIVDEIDRALERIANGSYGVCLPAGRRINLERLEALPYAETCVDCKARAERRR